MVQQSKTVGELLQHEREQQRVSLSTLAKLIRVREPFLKALEENRFTDLPAAVFVKGYVKAYARVLGFDPDPLLALLRRDFQEGAKGQLVAQELLRPSFRKGVTLPPIRLATSAAIGAFLILFIYIAVRWYGLIAPPHLEVFEPAEDAVVSSQVMVRGLAEPETVVTVNAQGAPVEADGSFEVDITLPTEGLSTITIEAKDRQDKVTSLQRTVFVRF